jgi:hypothetical protein
MEQIFIYLPREIYEVIFSYLNKSDLDVIFKLPEFEDVYDDNYFWNNQIKFNFSKYYLPNVRDYVFREVYNGLYILLNTNLKDIINLLKFDDEADKLILLNFPNLFELYFNYIQEINNNIRKLLKDNGIYLGINETIINITDIINKLITYINMNYPYTAIYLIKNNLIKGHGKMVRRKIRQWVIKLDYVPLIYKLLFGKRTLDNLLNKIIEDESLGPNIFNYLMNIHNPVLNDYLQIFSLYDVQENVVDIIYDKINNQIDNKIVYDLFYYMIDYRIHTEKVRYIWNKFRKYLSSNERIKLRDYAIREDYLRQDDDSAEYNNSEFYRTFT